MRFMCAQMRTSPERNVPMNAIQPSMYPLLFEPALYEKVWGGHQLETRLGKALPAGTSHEPIGEAWAIYWKKPGGNRALPGQTPGGLSTAHPEATRGSHSADAAFPLR